MGVIDSFFIGDVCGGEGRNQGKGNVDDLSKNLGRIVLVC